MRDFYKVNRKIFIYLVCFLFICILFHCFFINHVMVIDTYIYSNIVKREYLNKVFLIITKFGGKYILIILSFLILLFTKFDRKSKYLSVSLIFVFLCNYILKFSFARTRPSNMLLKETGYSFPSSHTMCATCFYILLCYFLYKKIDKDVYKYLIIFSFSTLIILIGMSRIYFNVHYFSDVIGGLVFGYFCAIMFINMFNRDE